MSNPERVSPKPAAGRDRGTAGELTGRCSQCDSALDPLRAARVRILDDRFHYFCSAECATDYEPRERPTPHPSGGETRRKSPAAPEVAPTRSFEVTADMPLPEVEPRRSAPPKPRVTPAGALTDVTQSPSPVVAVKRETPLPPGLPDAETPNRRTRAPSFRPTEAAPVAPAPLLTGTVLQQLSVACAALSLLLLLGVEGPLTSWLRLGLAGASSALQVVFVLGRSSRSPGDDTGRALWAGLAMSWASLGLAGFALLVDPNRDEGLVSLLGTEHLLWSLSLWWMAVQEAPLEETRHGLIAALERSVLRVSGDQTTPASAAELRPGEDIVVHAGELLPVDASIVAGSGEVNPWLHSDTVREVAAGDMLYAGARLVSGQVRAVVRWTGNDRHWLRLTADPSRRADRHAPSVALTRLLLTRVAPAVVALVALLSWSQSHGALTIAGYALAAAAVLANPALTALVRLEVLHATLTTLRHGIAIASAGVLDAAGRVSRAVFCARGTLLLGEPQLSTLEALGALSNDEILALVAGAEQSSSHPIASSVLRAARAASILPDAVRNPRSEPGLGVTALGSDGRALVVGSRALMLRERVSVAKAEARITELEATGRTVLLVALGGHLSAILSFQDGLRKGARAAVQHLLDAGIEPVLLSGDARETCEALAKTLDIEHVRPDVLPADRGKEVERLRSGGANVAVVGRSPVDDLPLASATISIALPSQGLQAAGFDIDLASDEVHKAALALRILGQHRVSVQRVIWLMFGGGSVCVLAGVLLNIPAAWLPFAAIAVVGLLRLLGSANQRHTADASSDA